ncbi:carboxymuconolactone decarboxylase family protein [Variovorax sp. V15]|jgi:alkylhydroperoxidase family enzyme|uniref:carboxymuconolactone decarboxylase family protein n=1 Tax=unclassified Variovorax TaxID=663243 RepID=UPI0034E89435
MKVKTLAMRGEAHERVAEIVNRCIAASRLSQTLVDLAHLRVSQLNCNDVRTDAHFLALLGAGYPVRKLMLVSDWFDAGTGLTPREKAALSWAEALVTAGEDGVGRARCLQVAAVFEHNELVALSLAIALENARSRRACAPTRGPLQ